MTGDVALLLAERAVLRTLYTLCHAVDDVDEAVWLAGFTEEGEFHWRRSVDANPELALRGHDQLAGWFRAHRARVPVGTQRHLLFHPVVEVDGDRARVFSRYMTIAVRNGELSPATEGRYDDLLVRGPDGSWRVRVRSAVGGGTATAAALVRWCDDPVV